MIDLTADNLLAFFEELKAFASQETWLIAPETYHAIQRINSQRPHQRLLRKCQIRRQQKRGRHR